MLYKLILYFAYILSSQSNQQQLLERANEMVTLCTKIGKRQTSFFGYHEN